MTEDITRYELFASAEEGVFCQLRKPPEPSEWQATLLPGLKVRPNKGCEPNAFHRFMQRLAFGIVWTRQ